MTTLVVTVAWAGRRRDLAVPADVPIADLLWPLALAVAFPGRTPLPSAAGPTPLPSAAGRTPAPGGAAGPTRASGGTSPTPAPGAAEPAPAPPEPDLALAPLGGGPLPADRTLGACGIGDGTVLVLIDRRHSVSWNDGLA
jgi:WXG100 protein secretion system (Wss), protein YukD